VSTINQLLSLGAPILKGHQDIAFYAPFHCACACLTGVLLPAEKTDDGTNGIYVSLAG
jgi:hypothetical protein